MTANQILNLPWQEINRMKTSDLRDVVRTLQQTSHKRIKRIAAADLRSPAVARYKQGYHGDINEMNLNQLRAELSRQRQFLNDPMSTVRGVRKDIKAMEDVLGQYGDIRDFMTKEQISKAYDVFDKLVEIYPVEFLRSTLGTGTVQVHIAEFMAAHPKYKKVDTILKHYMEDKGGLKDLLAEAEPRTRDTNYKSYVVDHQ